MVISGHLIAPKGFWELPIDKKKRICNGCGPSGWQAKLVPDSLFGVSLVECCNIHDYMYTVGEDIEDKEWADFIFYYNLYNTVMAGKKSPLRWLRVKLIWRYFKAVENHGYRAFFNKIERNLEKPKDVLNYVKRQLQVRKDFRLPTPPPQENLPQKDPQ